MATVVNTRSVALANANPRLLNAANAAVILTASTPVFHVDTSKNITPSNITIAAQLISIVGTVTFSSSGCTLTGISGNTATLTAANMTNSSATVTATITYRGQTFSSTVSINKVLDGAMANLIDLSWWARGASIPWTLNGEYNAIQSVGTSGADLALLGPKRSADDVWYCKETTGDGQSGGGWDFVSENLDPTKTYRFAVPIYKLSGSGGVSYWGVRNVCTLNTTTVVDGYFANSAGLPNDSLPVGKWHLFVGYIFPAGSTNHANDGAGVFDCTTGMRIVAGQNYCFKPGDGAISHRAYQYYAPLNGEQLFGRPMIHVVDGSEPSLSEFFNFADSLNAIASDGVLSRGKKTQVIVDWQTCDSEWNSLKAQASALGVSYVAYDTAHQNLSNYLISLSPGWSDTTQDTSIDPNTWKSKWNAYFDEKQKLINAMSAQAASSTFTPLASATWEFRNTQDGWSPSNGAGMTANADSITVTSTNNDPIIYSPSTNFSGGLYDRVRVKLRRKAGSGWDGTLFYHTSGHGDNGSYCASVSPGPSISDVWTILEFNMSASATPSDWLGNTITGLRLDLGASAADVFEIDWVSVGKVGPTNLPDLGHHTFRVIAAGANSNSTPAAGPGLFRDGVTLDGATRSYALAVVRRSDGQVTYNKHYDVFGVGAVGGGTAADLAADLNTIGSDYIAVVWTYDEPQGHRMDSGLADAMYRCGASRAVFGSSQFKYRSAYILVGIGGCGEGNGAEAYQGAVDSDANAWCDLAFTLTNGSISGVSGTYVPRTLVDYGYTGSMNATTGAPAGTNVGSTDAATVESNAAAGKASKDALATPLTVTLSTTGGATTSTYSKNGTDCATQTAYPTVSGGSGNNEFSWATDSTSPTATSAPTGANCFAHMKGPGVVEDVDIYLICHVKDKNTGQTGQATILFTLSFT